MMIRPQIKQADMKNKAEYVITVSWPNDNKDDIDTWLEDPLGGQVWFRVKEKNFAHLDRDDLGYVNDTVVMADGTIVACPRNQELTTIRGIIYSRRMDTKRPCLQQTRKGTYTSYDND